MPSYFEFDITLRYAMPPVWRRLRSPSTATFMDLHEAIQLASGWENYHLFRFEDSRQQPIAGIPDDEWGEPDPDAAVVRLDDHFPHGGTVTYLYDFGDSWECDVVCRDVLEMDESFSRRLVGGHRAFPPEDCGGITGYEDCVSVARGGADEEALREWLGSWHPERFDLEKAKRSVDV